MRHGLIFSGGGISLQQIVSFAKQAEDAGVDSIYLCEAWRSGFVGLAAIAMATERVEIGPYILNAYGRSPWLTAMSAIDLDELCGGRLVLGVGLGNKHINDDWQGIPTERPLKKMSEYVTVLKKAVSAQLGQTVRFDGEIHSMNWPPAVEPYRPTIPVYLAAFYPKMTAVAGRVADGLALGSLLSAPYVRDVIAPRFRAAAEEAGRDPASLGITASPFVSVGADATAARQAAREAICRLFHPLPRPYYDYVLREQGFSKAADAAKKYVPEGKMEKALEAFTDDIVDAVTVTGSLANARQQIDAFEGVVDQTLFVNVNYLGDSDEARQQGFRDLIALGGKY